MNRFGNFPLGWRRDTPDTRDFLYGAPPQTLRALPEAVDLRTTADFLPPVYDQGRIGSCTANAIAGAVQFDRRKAKESPDFVPSRLFIYYNERKKEHDVPYDAGAQLRDGIKTIVKLGVCPEPTWAYDDTPADPETHLFPTGAKAAQEPPASCYSDAKKYEALAYLRVTQNLNQIRGCLAEGFPFVFGITVYRSFWGSDNKPQTHIGLPSTNEISEGSLGGHAILGVGYDNRKNAIVCRNSWGSDVQEKGHFYLPYSYVADPHLASDFWTIRRMSA